MLRWVVLLPAAVTVQRVPGVAVHDFSFYVVPTDKHVLHDGAAQHGWCYVVAKSEVDAYAFWEHDIYADKRQFFYFWFLQLQLQRRASGCGWQQWADQPARLIASNV